MPKLNQINDNEWAFEADYSRSNMPKEVAQFLEQKMKSGELEQMSPEQVMRELMTVMPDAMHHIDDTPTQFDTLEASKNLLQYGDFELAKTSLEDYVISYPNDPNGWSMLSSALQMMDELVMAMLASRQGVDIYLKDFPSSFNWSKAKLDWAIHENRPFLANLSQLALSYGIIKMYEPAIDWAEKVIRLNPADNLGIREYLATFYLETKQYQKILSLAEAYPKDVITAEILYGKVLAYGYLNDKNNAKKAWQQAQKSLPLVAKELAKKRHTKPKMDEGYITNGSADQAYHYWKNNQQFWQNNAIAQQLLEDYRQTKK